MAGGDVLEELKAKMSAELPAGRLLYEQAITDSLGPHSKNVAWIKSHFSHLVESAQIHAYELYLEAERRAAAKAFPEVLGSLLREKPSRREVFGMLDHNFPALDRFFLGLTQGRRARAGRAFENIIKDLFDRLGYPYTPQPVINGQPDFLLPSVEHFRSNAMDCIIFTVKRSLRERWRQIVTEGTRGYLFFLATIDPNIGAEVLKEIAKNRIYLVMPELIRQQKYPNKQNAISFESFFEDHLDPAMKRWRRNGVI